MRHLLLTIIASVLASNAIAAPRTRPTTDPYGIPPNITIAPDGSGTYKTIQDCLDALPAYGYQTYTLHILPGVYKQPITIPRIKPHIVFEGEDAAKTILTYDLGANMLGTNGKPIGTFATPSVSILADDFTAKNITFENSLGPHGQALAVTIAGDRVAFDKCRFLGWQDTIFADSDGRNYFRDCYVEGHVDFIFGKSAAVFDHCEIHSKGGGYLTAASTTEDKPFGYVFLDCKLTADPSVKKASVYLGRPWRPYAATAFIRCEMGEHIRPQGWMNWNKPDREKTARYAEYGSTGPGGDMSQRVPWAKKLSDDEAKAYTVSNILGGQDHWQPLAEAWRSAP